MYKPAKSMKRELTREEEKIMLNFILKNRTMMIRDIAKHFEKRFKTPITTKCIANVMLTEIFISHGIDVSCIDDAIGEPND